jgi:WD40 repeat protein
MGMVGCGGGEVQTITGHTAGVNSVAFSPDGQHIVSGSRDKTLKIWDANNGKQLQTLTGHTGWVTSVSFSPDGQRIVSGNYDKTVKLWHASEPTE